MKEKILRDTIRLLRLPTQRRFKNAIQKMNAEELKNVLGLIERTLHESKTVTQR